MRGDRCSQSIDENRISETFYYYLKVRKKRTKHIKDSN